MKDELWTIQDVCARWKICERTFDRIKARYAKRLKPIRMTKRTVRFARAAVEAFEKWRGEQ
jgi:hypothetical protein